MKYSEPKSEKSSLRNRLRVQEFMVLSSGGVPIFHYSREHTRKLDELLSGFLTAITSFASEFGERSIQSLSFEGSELLYEQTEEEAIFIFLVDTGTQKKVLRAVLKDLSRKFLLRYDRQLKSSILVEEDFKDFAFEVERAFNYYEGVMMITSNLSAYVVPILNKELMDIAVKSEGLIDEFHRDFGGPGNRVLEAIDGNSSITKMSEDLGLEVDEISEIIEYLAIWGVLEIAKLCPVLKENDARFDAFLDIIGLPQKDYQLLERAKLLCNGSNSVIAISERINVTADRLYEVLVKLGDEVEWQLQKVTSF